MSVSMETIDHIARLAKLRFSEEETREFAREFGAILDHFENIEREDLTGFGLGGFKPTETPLREDVMKAFENKKELFQNVREMKEGHIVIPKVIE